MARVPEIIRRNPLSQVAAEPPKSGQGFAALADMMNTAASFIKPAAAKQAEVNGKNAVYRDDDGKLKIDERSVLGGEMAAIHNAAAYGNYLAKKQMDVSATFSELTTKYEFDPAGFDEASTAYVNILQSDVNIPKTLKDDLINQVQKEAQTQFNGLRRKEINRTYDEADINTKTSRDMLADDYVSLYVQGDLEAAEDKMEEIIATSKFRSDAPYIGETKVQTEAYLRGIRGSAKAGRLIRDLAELEGAESISEEKRNEISAVLKDEDISPKVRDQLYNASMGRLKSIDATAIVSGMTNSSYEAMVVRNESSGVDTAKAETSSAYGPHQFLKGTWAGLVKRYKPEWAQGLSDGQVQALRGDRAKSSEMFAHFRRENQDVLRANGLPINPATEYMAHFFGAGTAAKVLSADPTKPLSEVVSDATIKANSFLKGMTAGDARNWAARKMTMKASDMANMAVKVNEIDDLELRGMAAKKLNEQVAIRSALEEAAKDAYAERVATGDESLTRREIFEDHDLATSDQVILSNALDKMRKAEVELQDTVVNLNNPNFNWSAADKNQVSAVDKVYTSKIGDTKPLDTEDGRRLATAITSKTGFVPRTMFNALAGAVKSSDPETLSNALEYAAGLLSTSSEAFGKYAGSKSVENALSDYQFHSQFTDGASAAQKVIDAREKAPKNLTDEAKKAAEKLTISDITDHLDIAYFSDPSVGVAGADKYPDIGEAMQQNEMMSEYTRLFKDEYLETGDSDLAKNRALKSMDRIYGVNTVSGSSRVMKYPPQKVYPAVLGSHDWMQEQLEEEVSAFVFGAEIASRPTTMVERFVDGASLGGATNWVRAKNIKLVSDGTTRAEVTSGRPASYVVYYMQDGVLHQAPQRFAFDPSEAKSAQREVFEADRAGEISDASGGGSPFVSQTMDGLRRFREEVEGDAISE